MTTKPEESGSIEIKGGRVHNLKNIDLIIPRDEFIVITGLSGSGKSSLAFDTIYAEGQRRYVESLSSYARQFLGRMHKPEVDYIHGIPPAIAIQQRVNTRNPRSTVGTSTEIYDYLKLLYARIGRTFSPISGKEVRKHNVKDVIDFINKHPEGENILIYVKLTFAEKVNPFLLLQEYQRKGFSRVEINGRFYRITDIVENKEKFDVGHNFNLLVDRVVLTKNEEEYGRLADSLGIAFDEGHGFCFVRNDKGEEERFSVLFEEDGIGFEEPTVHTFSFNNPLGACPRCEGYGNVLGIDPDLVIPDKTLSVYDEAIVCWRGEKMSEWKDQLVYSADKFGFPIHKPYYELTEEQKQLLWKGNRYFKGIDNFFDYLEEKKYKIQYRVMLSRYRGRTVCPDCKGTRLKKEASYVKINGYSIHDLVLKPVDQLMQIFKAFELDGHEQKVADRILTEITNRLTYLVEVGLGYLTLNRLSSTLSGGESQRINLATSLGSSLVGSLYILDEPSIGLHPRDTNLLIGVLKKLKDLGNTVMVVEHEEEMIRAANRVIDIGPAAGAFGGEVVFNGTHNELLHVTNSLTADYLTGKKKIETPRSRRKWNQSIQIVGARENNLRNIKVTFPLNVITVVTGVSGSGKSTLVKNILYQALNKLINRFGDKTGDYDTLLGDYKSLSGVEFVNQDPIGRSSRSNPVTYIKAYDDIRKLFASQKQSEINGFKPSHFSFNTDGGRCDACQGEGIIRVEMQFMADVELVCDSCQGKRFKEEVLEVKYKEKNIFDILDMSVNQAIAFFTSSKKSSENRIAEKLQPLADVGLGYIKLGQSSSTLSGGESQRVKLASFLGKEQGKENLLFIFDEPTTGLHFHDINKLMASINALVDKGHSVLIIEHNPEVIKCADWVIDLGPEGGLNGGQIVFEGIPEDLALCEASYTGHYLKDKL
jgi:excinuclease ABC subunit A